IGEPLRGVYSALVPIFFVVIGTLVDVTSWGGVWQFGLVFAALAVISKVAGTGLPALFTGFNRHGARRIGFGMLPRVEVTLVVAGIGISQEIIGGDLLGVSIMMIMICTVTAPLMLSRSFREGVPGTRSKPPT
ncbi:MAG: cation:proton antiporter, partial [Dehalococcoidia bacterium]|nr:cation:proton antiporter [Dehalococcoidia bacterium]